MESPLIEMIGQSHWHQCAGEALRSSKTHAVCAASRTAIGEQFETEPARGERTFYCCMRSAPQRCDPVSCASRNTNCCPVSVCHVCNLRPVGRRTGNRKLTLSSQGLLSTAPSSSAAQRARDHIPCATA